MGSAKLELDTSDVARQERVDQSWISITQERDVQKQNVIRLIFMPLAPLNIATNAVNRGYIIAMTRYYYSWLYLPAPIPTKHSNPIVPTSNIREL